MQAMNVTNTEIRPTTYQQMLLHERSLTELTLQMILCNADKGRTKPVTAALLFSLVICFVLNRKTKNAQRHDWID